MSEAEEQITVVEYCDLKRIPVYHVPNEAKRSPQGGLYMRRLGLRAGVPDLCIPVARGKYHSLYIEMKTKKGRVTERQADWIELLREQGMCAYVCHGADNAIALIDLYMAEKL